MSLDPSDVYPKRNLPPEAENWGRHIENDTGLLKRTLRSAQDSIKALSRTFASSLQQQSTQLELLAEQQAAAPETRAFDIFESSVPLTNAGPYFGSFPISIKPGANALTAIFSLYAVPTSGSIANSYFEVVGDGVVWSGAPLRGNPLSATGGYTYMWNGDFDDHPLYVGWALGSSVSITNAEIMGVCSVTSWKAPQSDVDEWMELHGLL